MKAKVYFQKFFIASLLLVNFGEIDMEKMFNTHVGSNSYLSLVFPETTYSICRTLRFAIAVKPL